MPDDVRVAGVLDDRELGGLELEEPPEEGAARRLFLPEPAAHHVAVAVGGAALVERDRVDHPVAVEPVVAAERREGGVRTAAVVGAVQLAGNLPDDGEVPGLAFRGPGREVSLQEGVWSRVGRHGAASFRVSCAVN